MYHVTEDERAHKLMYKSFELSLSRPTDSQIAKTILSNEDCNKVQSENNLSFLGRVRDVVVMFLQRNELEYRQHNNLEDNPQCECDYDCECYLNKFIMPAFKNLALKFEPYIKDDSLVNRILGCVDIYRIIDNHSVMTRLTLSDAQWAKIAPYCSGKETDVGRTAVNNRLFIEAVLWIVRTGSPWRDLPPEFGNWNSVYKRYRRWVKSDRFSKLFNALNDSDLEYAMIDGTIVKVHRHGQGAKGGLVIRQLANQEAV